MRPPVCASLLSVLFLPFSASLVLIALSSITSSPTLSYALDQPASSTAACVPKYLATQNQVNAYNKQHKAYLLYLDQKELFKATPSGRPPNVKLDGNASSLVGTTYGACCGAGAVPQNFPAICDPGSAMSQIDYPATPGCDDTHTVWICIDPAPGAAAKKAQAAQQQASQTADEKAHNDSLTDSSDPCAVSDQIGTAASKDYRCATTYSVVKGAQVLGVVGQLAGSTATQVAGASAQYNAYGGSSGTVNQGAALSGSASTTIIAAEGQIATGAGYMASALLQASQYSKNSSSAAALADSNLTSAADIRRSTKYYKDDAAAEQGRKVAVSEQNSAKSAAMAGAIMSAIQGSQMLLQGSLNYASGKQLQKAADALNNSTTGSADSTLTPPGLGDPASGATTASGGSTAITGSGVNPTPTSTADTSAPSSPLPDLGNGFNTSPLPSGLPSGPPVAGPSTPPAAGGGGAGGNVDTSGATGPAGPQQNEDATAKLAPKDAGDKYAGGSTFSGGGNRAAAPAGNDNSLSALLEKFLPKKEDADANKNGIAVFGNQGDGGGAPFSPLDRGTNIFKSVSETYMQKTKAGQI